MGLIKGAIRSIAQVTGMACLVAGTLYHNPASAGTEIIFKDVRELEFGNGLFHLYQNKNFSGIIKLSTALQNQKIKHQVPEARLALATLYLSYGLHRTAASRTINLTTKGRVLDDIRNHIWFYIANIRYQRGYFNQAESALTNITGALPLELEQKLQSFTALLLMDRRQYPMAMRALSNIKGYSAEVPFALHNLAVSLIQLEEQDKGSEILGKVIQMKPKSAETAALIDRAYLTLGFDALAEDDPQKAVAYFEKVHLYGLESNDALLGLGWAYYNMEQYEKALVPWMELAGRDVSETTVQEARVAVPYTLSKIEAFGQAMEHYEFAFNSFKEEHTRISNTIKEVKSGDFFRRFMYYTEEQGEGGWMSDIHTLPEVTGVVYFSQMLARHDYQETMKNYRDLIFLQSKLDTWKTDLDAYNETATRWANQVTQQSGKLLKQSLDSQINSLLNSKEAYARELARIEETGDARALASEQDIQYLAELEQLENQINTEPQGAEKERRLNRVRLMRGRVNWSVYSNFSDHLNSLKTELVEIDKLLIEQNTRYEELATKANNAGLSVRKMQPQIKQVYANISRTRPGIVSAVKLVESYLQEISLKDLEARQNVVSDFLAQVAFSVAQSYDAASKKEEQGR